MGGFCVPHNPLITGKPDAASQAQATRVQAAYQDVRDGIEALNADTVVVVGDDHCAMFAPGCQPSILIGIGDLEGPLEPESWLRIPRRHVANNCGLAEHILHFGLEHGFDWAVAKTLVLDHSTMVPLHLAVPAHVRAIPVYISSGMTPLIRGERCRQLGKMISSAISEWAGDERVVIIGTGGISHWVGMSDSGRVNVSFDKMILELVQAGDVDALVALSDQKIIDEGGNGALEIRNWITAMAAVPGCACRLIAYEPVEPWITGLGFIEMSSDV
nr:hypothetical protein [uncultured bacterium]